MKNKTLSSNGKIMANWNSAVASAKKMRSPIPPMPAIPNGKKTQAIRKAAAKK